MQNSEIYEAFARKKKRQNWITALTIIIIIGMVPFRSFSSSVSPVFQNILLWSATLFIIALIVLSFINWRCPSCERWLGRETKMAHCKHCGVKLVEYYDA